MPEILRSRLLRGVELVAFQVFAGGKRMADRYRQALILNSPRRFLRISSRQTMGWLRGSAAAGLRRRRLRGDAERLMSRVSDEIACD